jgi:hypothetical protein
LCRIKSGYLNKFIKNKKLFFEVILSTRQDGIAGLGAKDLVSNTKSRFFSGTKILVQDQNDNALYALMVYYLFNYAQRLIINEFI